MLLDGTFVGADDTGRETQKVTMNATFHGAKFWELQKVIGRETYLLPHTVTESNPG